MKNITKFIIIFLFVFIDINAIGQTVLVKGGLSFARFTNITESGNRFLPLGHRKGFHLGVSYEQALSDFFLLETGPMLHKKGSNHNSPYNVKVTTFHIDVPILLKMHFKLTDNLSFYNVAGTYFGLGIVGNLLESSEKIKIEWSETEYGLERLDFGLVLGAGFIFKHVQFGFGYDRGLFNVNADNTRLNDKTRNNVIRLSIAFRFEKKEK